MQHSHSARKSLFLLLAMLWGNYGMAQDAGYLKKRNGQIVRVWTDYTMTHDKHLAFDIINPNKNSILKIEYTESDIPISGFRIKLTTSGKRILPNSHITLDIQGKNQSSKLLSDDITIKFYTENDVFINQIDLKIRVRAGKKAEKPEKKKEKEKIVQTKVDTTQKKIPVPLPLPWGIQIPHEQKIANALAYLINDTITVGDSYNYNYRLHNIPADKALTCMNCQGTPFKIRHKAGEPDFQLQIKVTPDMLKPVKNATSTTRRQLYKDYQLRLSFDKLSQKIVLTPTILYLRNIEKPTVKEPWYWWVSFILNILLLGLLIWIGLKNNSEIDENNPEIEA
jgi:hypothetical protein